MNWYLEVLKKYAVFSGRARRKEFWMLSLFHLIITLILGLTEWFAAWCGVIGVLYGLAVLIPTIAVSVRGLHDTGRSGWWVLIAFIPVVGIVLLVFMVQDSKPGQNQYGENPKEAAA